VVLILIEIASLVPIRGIAIFGLGVAGWRLSDSLELTIYGTQQSEPHHLWTYNLAGVLGDRKKILFYGLVLLWLLRSRDFLARCLRTIEARHVKWLALGHILLGVGLLCIYDYSQLYSNQWEHWTGESRMGLLSSWYWLPDYPVQPFWRGIFLIFLYRLSYTLQTAFLFLVGTFPFMALMLASREVVSRRKASLSAWELLPDKERGKWKEGPDATDKWLSTAHRYLVLFIGGGAWGSWYLYQNLGFTPWQLLTACLVLGILVSLVIILGRQRISVRQLKLARDVTVIPLLVYWTTIYGGASEVIFHAAHGEPDSYKTEERAAAAKLINAVDSTFLEAGDVLDRTRVLWETLRVNQGSRLASETLYAIWAIRLEKLETLFPSSCPSAYTDRNGSVSVDGGIASVVRKPCSLTAHSHYRWSIDGDCRREAGWRWRGRLANEISEIRTVDKLCDQETLVSSLLDEKGLFRSQEVGAREIA